MLYEYEENETPQVFSTTNFVVALLFHAVLFAVLWMLGSLKSSDPDETIIPVECLVVVHENLDGVEGEPPPESEPVETPPPEEEPPVEQPDPPPKSPPVVPDQVIEIPDEKPPEKPKEVEKPKPPEVKPPEPPKETPEQKKKRLDDDRKKRIDEMRQSMVKDKTPPPRNNGKTDKRPENWRDLLNAGYKPAAVNSGLDASEEQICLANIKRAFHDKWSPRPAWTSELRKMKLNVSFDMGGRVKGYSLIQSSGDRKADETVLSAAKRVPSVPGLTRAFLEKHSSIVIEFEVTPM